MWIASALLLLPVRLIAHAASYTVDHRVSGRRLPIATNQLHTINDVAHPLHRINRKIRRADDQTIQALLKRARPHIKEQQRRKLDDNSNGQFDGSYSLKFSQCLDVQTYNADLFDQDILEYSSSGKVVSVKSYVLFYICQTNVNCDYDADDVDLYMVDLPTYLSTAAQYHANIRNDYCEVCEKFEDYCNPQQEEEAVAAVEEQENAEEEMEDAAAERQEEGQENENPEEAGKEQEGNPDGEQGDEGGRKLKTTETTNERKLASKAINCDQCTAYECYAAKNDDDQVQSREELDKSIAEWITDLAECKEAGVQWNNMDLYVSAMCTPYGDGVELAVFVNQDCTMYTNQQSVYDVWNLSNNNENGVNYMTYAEEIIQSAFRELTPCSQQEYGSPDGYDGNDADEVDGNEDENEMNEYCRKVLEGEFVNFHNCASEENDDQENAADDGQYNWYKYDVKNADDINEVCTVLNQKEGAYTWSYDMETSGTWYERDSNGQIASKDSAAMTSSAISIAPTIICVLVTMCVFVVGGAAHLIRRRQKWPVSSESVYSGGEMI